MTGLAEGGDEVATFKFSLGLEMYINNKATAIVQTLLHTYLTYLCHNSFKICVHLLKNVLFSRRCHLCFPTCAKMCSISSRPQPRGLLSRTTSLELMINHYLTFLDCFGMSLFYFSFLNFSIGIFSTSAEQLMSSAQGRSLGCLFINPAKKRPGP